MATTETVDIFTANEQRTASGELSQLAEYAAISRTVIDADKDGAGRQLQYFEQTVAKLLGKDAALYVNHGIFSVPYLLAVGVRVAGPAEMDQLPTGRGSSLSSQSKCTQSSLYPRVYGMYITPPGCTVDARADLPAPPPRFLTPQILCY